MQVHMESQWEKRPVWFVLHKNQSKRGKHGNKNSGRVREWCFCLWWKCCQLISDGEMECFALAVFRKDGLGCEQNDHWIKLSLQTEGKQSISQDRGNLPQVHSSSLLRSQHVFVSYVNVANSSRPLWMWGKEWNKAVDWLLKVQHQWVCETPSANSPRIGRCKCCDSSGHDLSLSFTS